MKVEINTDKGVTVFGHSIYPNCKHCNAVKDMLVEEKVQYTFVYCDKKMYGQLMKETGMNDIPQVFVDGEFIGGSKEAFEYFNKPFPFEGE